MKDETVWLSLEQLSKLFERDKSVISRHIKNALTEELDFSSVANFATVQKEWKRELVIPAGVTVTVENNTLTVLTLFIAESNPKEKDIIVDLIIHMIKG